MPLIDLRKFNKFYSAMVRCKNCHSIEELRVPKGETVDEYVSSDRAICSACGCATLELKKGDKKKDEKKGTFG